MSGRPEGNSRQGNRIRTGIPAEIHYGGKKIACEVRNISRGGVLLVGDLEAPSTATLDFVIILPPGGLELRLSGSVIRFESDVEGGGQRLALALVEMDESRRAAMEVLLARLLETLTAGPFDRLKPGATIQEIKKALEAVPLPQRISLASRAGVKDREILRWDTHVAVLEALARNVNLTLMEARGIAASTFLTSVTLDALANDPRFKSDEELRMLVAVHPRVALSTAEKVTADFKTPQLRKLLTRPGLSQMLRDKLIRRVVNQR